MNRIWCSHYDTTATDRDGRAICLVCGGVIQMVLTRELLDESLRKVFTHGAYPRKP